MNEHLYRSRDDRMIAGVAGGLADLWDADPSLIRIVWALLVFLTGGLALLVYVVMAIVVPEEEPWPAAPAAGPPPAAPTPTPAPAATDGPASVPADAPSDGSATGGLGDDPTVATSAVAAATLPPPTAAAPPSSQPLVSPASEPGALWAAPPTDPQRAARADARAARRAARAERRVNRSGLTGTMIAGGILIAIGAFFLLREWLPELSFDWFWPSLLIVAGIVLLVAAGAGRKPRDPGAPG